MKKILIATDFSKHSKFTIEYVLDLMLETKIPCQICLLNTYMVQQTDPSRVIFLNDELKSFSKAGLEKEREEIEKKITNSQITIETASHIGTLNNVVLQMIQKHNYDLVAMGKSDGDNVESISKVLKHQKCPLLITYLPEDR